MSAPTTVTPPASTPPGSEIDRAGRISLVLLRLTLGIMWLSNAGWKRPPDFGEETGTGLFRFTSYAVEHEVFPPFAWLVETVVLPNFRFFGWVVLFTEALLGAFLLLGLLTRFWGLVGALMSLNIALSVLLAPGEWAWAYYLMVAGHLVLAGTAAGRCFGLDGALRPLWMRSPGRLTNWGVRLS
jgi:thiosulfate dehydrogenase (quinone) large subunit